MAVNSNLRTIEIVCRRTLNLRFEENLKHKSAQELQYIAHL